MTSPVSIPAGHKLLASDFDAYENATAAWVTWSPTLFNLTLGSGTVTAKYRQVGKTVDYRFKFLLGAGSAVGTGPAFTLPVAPHANFAAGVDPLGDALLHDATGTAARGIVRLNAGSTVDVLAMNTGVTASITATNPFTWTTSDVIACSGTYEAA